MIHDPVANTITAAAKVRHPSFYLLAATDQARRVAGWGRALATCCASGRISRVQVLERTMPDTGQGVRQYWAQHGQRDGGWAATQYETLIEHAAPTSERHETTISVSVDLTRTRRAVRAHGGGITGAAAVLRRLQQPRERRPRAGGHERGPVLEDGGFLHRLAERQACGTLAEQSHALALAVGRGEEAGGHQ